MTVSDTTIHHPAHYGGDTPFEAIKIIEAAGLGFNLGNAIKYIIRHERKGDPVRDLGKALFYARRAFAAPMLPPQPMTPMRWQVEAAEAHGLKGHPRVAFLAILDAASSRSEREQKGLLRMVAHALEQEIEEYAERKREVEALNVEMRVSAGLPPVSPHQPAQN